MSACGKKAGETPAAGGDAAKPATPAPPAAAATPDVPPAPPIPPPPLGLPPTPAPADNPDTAEKVALGELLFFDKRLSDSGTFACETCHQPEKGWGDGLPLSPKFNGKLNKRHSPTLFNVAYANEWYWDGRKPTLESQILAAWTGQVGGTPDKVAAKLAAIPEYATRFQRAFGEGPTADNIPKALASFLRIKLRSGDSPWDRYEKSGDASAVSPDAIAGFKVFTETAACALCHAPPLYTDMLYHNVGVGYEGNDSPDPGRFAVTKDPKDTGAFKTPGLRGVTLHPPYFHDGSGKTLEDAVDFMIGGGYRKNNPHIDPKLKPKKLTAKQRAQLLAFLRALTPDTTYQRPKLP
ncbi:MAG: cytochrome-c peroxidase [Deltaproteobacteria bacterium]|nr:MAG: cytochrome-c peroxidase [Deltaproteobacteria bacterium]